MNDKIRQGFLKKSASNRRFFDHLCLLIWCECKAGCTTKSKSWQEWCNIELFSFTGVAHGVSLYESLATPREKLSEKELDYIQEFINTHTFVDLAQAKREIADGLFNDCTAAALNILDVDTIEDVNHPIQEYKQTELKF